MLLTRPIRVCIAVLSLSRLLSTKLSYLEKRSTREEICFLANFLENWSTLGGRLASLTVYLLIY